MDDNNNQDGKSPGAIQVQLYANGKAEGSPVAVNQSINWMYSWKDLAMKSSGKDIAYTVKEVNVPDGYTVPLMI